MAKPVSAGDALATLLGELGIQPDACRVAQNLVQLDDRDAALHAERVERAKRGTATREDLDALNATARALEHRPRLPPSARVPPGPERELPVSDDAVERVIAMGVPPLIAARVAHGQCEVDTIAMQACAQFYAERLSILVLIGERGCGKTFAAAHWLVNAVHRCPPPMRGKTTPRKFVDADMLSGIDRTVQQQVIANAIALVFDDAGVEDERYQSENVAALIARRYRNALPTVITTNLNERDFGRRYGARINDRLAEVGRFVVCGTSVDASLRRRKP